MKSKLISLLMALAVLASVHSVLAQDPVITSFSQNGVLVCTNLGPGSLADVEWASSLAGPWHADWTSLKNVAVGTNKTITVSVPMFYRVLGIPGTNSVPDGMAFIPAGSFTIGDTVDGNSLGFQGKPTNVVYVSAFFMDTNLVSGSQWQAVLAYATNNGHVFVGGSSFGFAKGTNYPVSILRWYDAVNWINARSRQAGLTPVYYADAGLTEVYTNGLAQTNDVFAKWTANGYRLPTEAEWEKAARGGLSERRFPWGNFISWNEANYFGNTNILNGNTYPSYSSYGLSPPGYNPAFTNGPTPYTSPVGSFAPNGYGLYDMAGNVWQMCWDWYAGPPYPAGSPYLGGSDPRGPASGSSKEIRGGSFADLAGWARCAQRTLGNSPGVQYVNVGFRCVRGL